jgi:transmembrane sensor
MADPFLDTDDPVWREALDWFLRLRQAPDDPQLQASLNQWLATSEENRSAFEEAGTIWELTARTAPVFREQWQRKPANEGTKTVKVPGQAAKPVSAGRRIFFGAAGATLAAVLASTFFPGLWLHWRADYSTGVGERRVIDLTDGSRLHLNTQSAVRVNLTDRERWIDLLSGEGFFEVSPDAMRPFVVGAGTVAVRVVGTKFNVRLETAAAMVSVASGRVSIGLDGSSSTQELTAGQSVHVTLASGQFHRGTVATNQVAAWQEGQLIIGNRTIAAVVAELRRYHRGFILLDDELAEKTISGVYNLNDPIGALKAVVQPHRGVVRSLTPYLLIVSSR